MSFQCVLLLPYCVNAGEGTKTGVLFPTKGVLTMVMTNAPVLSLCWGMLSAKQNQFGDTGWKKPTPKVALTSQRFLPWDASSETFRQEKELK